jgi:alpha,alpha-trehalose phosphorylase
VTPAEVRRASLHERLEHRLGSGTEWQLVDAGFDPAQSGALESLFALGNGYLGLRGTGDEGRPAHDPGVVLNGFHETWPIAYPEDAHGLARTGQAIVSPPDGSVIRLFIDDEPFDLDTARVRRFERVLDMRAGELHREVEFETTRGRRIAVRSSRLVSLDDRHLAAIVYEVAALDAPVYVAVSSQLATHTPVASSDDPRRSKGLADDVLVPVSAEAAGCRAVLELATRDSGLHVACGIEHEVESDAEITIDANAESRHAAVLVEASLEPGERLMVTKYVAYHWASDAPAGELRARARRTLDRAARAGYGALEFAHRRHVCDYWSRSDVQIEGAPAVQKAVRFNLFQLMQNTARSEGLGVAAKGVTGRGYEGHYFWDTDIYVMPFLTHSQPELARQLLGFRAQMLGAARRRAAELGHEGALYPWRTIAGDEASAWYAAGTAQYHINADVTHAMQHYSHVSGDLDFMLDHGAEVFVETARFWMDLGFFSQQRDGRFAINAVTGPDEYTAVVDNNAYTNAMAKQNLEGAVRALEALEATDPCRHADFAAALGVTSDEVESWRRAALAMHVPRDEGLGIVLQDDHFLERKRWDFASTPPERYPLLLHFHPLEIYRHQVIKQTDVVLASYLAGDEFTADEKRRTFDYYDPLTTGDSTLSACIQSVLASEVGYPDAALDYFLDACAVDLLDLHRNTGDGIHVASCGGTWLALIAGFAGLRDFDGAARFAPRLPVAWERLRFNLEFRGQTVEVDMRREETVYTLLAGDALTVHHFDERLKLIPGVPARRGEVQAPALAA